MHFCREIRLNSVTPMTDDDDSGDKKMRIHIVNRINLRNFFLFICYTRKKAI